MVPLQSSQTNLDKRLLSYKALLNPRNLYEIFKPSGLEAYHPTSLAASAYQPYGQTNPNLSPQKSPTSDYLHKQLLRVGTNLFVLTEILSCKCKFED